MVGLPRLSRISRARTAMIVLMMARTLAGDALGVNARLQVEDRSIDAVAQLLASLDRHPDRGDRRTDRDSDRPRSQDEPPLGQDLERVANVQGHAGIRSIPSTRTGVPAAQSSCRDQSFVPQS